jgi:predicted dehydrogenase
MSLRGGLVGCGFFARNHLNAWKEVRGAEIAAVCDLDEARARAYAAEWGIPAFYTSPETMLAEAPLDFVDVVTQPAGHRPLVELAARHGKHVICQKPLAGSMDDARAMVAVCHAAGVRLMVHENFRWQRPMRALKAAAETLGPLHFGRIGWRSAYDVYRDQPYLAEDPRFIIADLGVHLLDLARFFMGEVEQLYCQTRTVNPRVRGEDTATIMLRTAGGGSCVVELSFASRLEEELFPETLVQLEGERGSATLGPHYALAVASEAGVERRDARPHFYPWSAPMFAAIQESVVATQQHWTDCLGGGREPETSGEDNLRTLALVYGAYESAAAGEVWRPSSTRSDRVEL